MFIETPLLESRALSQRLNKSVWLKMEAMQPTGSFKARGIGHACTVYKARGARRFVSSSGGNAGLAVAYAGRKLGVPVLVVVPETTSERAKHLIAREDAEVVVHGKSWQEANEFALASRTSADAFLHPFDDPLNSRRAGAEVVEDIHDERIVLGEQPEQEMLGPHVLVVAPVRLLARLDQRAAYPSCEVVASQRASLVVARNVSV